jgi:hypothetical protein
MNAGRTGRKPAGPQIAEGLEGSPVAKQRLEVILKTLAGQLTVTQACQQLGIGESRFHALRHQALQTTLEALEPRPLGRPAKPTSPEQAGINELQAELRRLHADWELTQLQLSLARIHPGLIGIQPAADDRAGKKNARPARQQRQQRRAQRRRQKAK